MTSSSSGPVVHFVYILRCADSSLYIGEADDADRRVARHQEGRACAYTAARLPVKLVHLEELAGRLEALRRESQLKKWTRRKKEGWSSDAGTRFTEASCFANSMRCCCPASGTPPRMRANGSKMISQTQRRSMISCRRACNEPLNRTASGAVGRAARG